MLTTLLSFLAVENLFSPHSTPPVDNNFVVAATIPQATPPANPYPEIKPTAISPVLKSKSIISVDLATGQILYQDNSDQQLPMASLTKLMTALVILENHQLDEVVTVNKLATQVEPAKMDLLANEKITVKELLKGLFIKSANDAALALALYDSPTVDDFVAKMNKRAVELDMSNTHFVNPVGFDDPAQYSTATDLATLARLVYKNPIVQKIAVLKVADASSVNGKQSHHLTTTNDLLDSYLHVLGLKTGTTDEAGQCLITIVENQNGNKILNVMLGSNDRFKESKILSQWLFDSVNWI